MNRKLFICIITDCGKTHHAKGLCRTHYMEMYSKGYKSPNLVQNTSRYHYSLKGNFNTLKANAKKRNLSVEFSFNEYCKIREQAKDCCYYCGNTVSGTTGGCLDRKNSFKDYTIGNVVVCCDNCNWTKNNNLTFYEMLNLMNFRNETNLLNKMLGGC
jgi:hypothetical protein